MSVGKSIFYLLSNASGVSSIVSTRIYPSRIPQIKDFPAISYHKVAHVPTNQKDAVSGFDREDFDIICWGKNYLQLNTLSAAVRTALDRIAISSQGATIDTIVFVSETDNFNDAAEIFQRNIQFKFIVKR